MAERKENEKASEPKESDLRHASPKSDKTPKISPIDRADYWYEQDPKYANG